MEQRIVQFIRYAIEQSRKFIELLDELSASSAAVRKNPVVQVVINHIRRESEYFIGIAGAF